MLTPAQPLAVDGLVPALAAHPGATATCYLVELAGRQVAFVVDVQGIDDELEAVIAVTKDLFDPDVPLQQDSQDLLDARALTQAPKTHSYPHQIVLLPAQSATLHAASLSGEPLDLEQALRQLVFKDTDIRYDPEHAPVSRPGDTAAGRPMHVVVWDTMTVVEGLEAVRDSAFAENRLAAMVEVNAQVLAARTETARIRDQLLSTVETQTGTSASRDTMVGRLEKLREVRRRLVRDVSVLLSGLAVEGGRPLVSYHRCLVTETGIRDEVQATEMLLSELVRISELDRQTGLLEDARAQARRQADLLDTSRAIRLLGTVFATVSLLLGAAGVVAAFAAIPSGDDTWVGGVPRGFVWGAAIGLSALTLGVVLAVVARLRPPSWFRPWTAAGSAAAAGVAVLSALALWRGESQGVVRLAFAAFVGALIVAVVAVTAAVDFDRKLSPDGEPEAA